jgi:hypothetical protein
MKNSSFKNSNKFDTYSGVVLQMAVNHLQNIGINHDGLLEVIMRTENPDLALMFLSGKYEQPKFAHKVIIKNDVICTFMSYNPWDNMVTYSFERNKTKRIHVPKGTDKEYIDESNYTQFEVEWSSNGNTEPITFTLSETEQMVDVCNMVTWNNATVINEDNFIPPFPSSFNEDIF